jgi:hypothetical protein
MVNYIDDENDSEFNSCYVNIKNSDADTYKVKKTKVYYNDHKCSLSLIKIHNKNNIDYLIIDIIVILVAIYFIYPQIKWTIESIINYNLMKHFENHKPLVFEDVECTSKKVGKLLNKKTFNVELKVNIKNHGEVLINKKVKSFDRSIKHINVLIDPDNTKKVLLLEDYELKEYKKYSK